MYESGAWIIENQKTFLNPTAGWGIYESRILIGRERTLGDAKMLVEKELARRGTRKIEDLEKAKP
jgi:hypothetical protein